MNTETITRITVLEAALENKPATRTQAFAILREVITLNTGALYGAALRYAADYADGEDEKRTFGFAFDANHERLRGGSRHGWPLHRVASPALQALIA